MSIGIAQFPLHGTNQEDLVRHADQALYQAKHGLDGKVCFYRKAD
ncbi:diguanylate cyclase domain-containing protein [Maribrevibacterium harenarium]|nr:diguanylate cyclase [Maribrevibacterium harenarium]